MVNAEKKISIKPNGVGDIECIASKWKEIGRKLAEWEEAHIFPIECYLLHSINPSMKRDRAQMVKRKDV